MKKLTPKLVRELREAAGTKAGKVITQAEAAKMVGRTRVTWARWEAPTGAPNALVAPVASIELFCLKAGIEYPTKAAKKPGLKKRRRA